MTIYVPYNMTESGYFNDFRFFGAVLQSARNFTQTSEAALTDVVLAISRTVHELGKPADAPHVQHCQDWRLAFLRALRGQPLQEGGQDIMGRREERFEGSPRHC